MSRWRLCWSETAIASLVRLGLRDASRVDAAILRLARTGEGDLVRLPADHAVTVRLRVPPYAVRFTLDPIEGVAYVWAVYKFQR